MFYVPSLAVGLHLPPALHCRILKLALELLVHAKLSSMGHALPLQQKCGFALSSVACNWLI